MTNLQTFKNGLFEVEAKEDNGTVMFDLEKVAINLGFTENKGSKKYVMWRRVNQYINSFGASAEAYPQMGTGDFISEPMVYALAFKASNETALKFQQWLAVEVIPSIRKTGSYQKPMTLEEQRREHLLLSIATSERLDKAEEKIGVLFDTMTIDSRAQNSINSAGKNKVVETLGGKKTNAYKQFSRSTFSMFWSEFNNFFGISTYKDLPKAKLPEAEYFISMWNPKTSVKLDIERINNQIDMVHVFGNF